MGKSLSGKELGANISQEKRGYYVARFVCKDGRRLTKRFKKLQDCKKWIIEAKYKDENNLLRNISDMTVDELYEQWIKIKEKTVRIGTFDGHVRKYKNHIKPVLGDMKLKDLKALHIQNLFNVLADAGLKSSTISETRYTLKNMLDFAVDNEIMENNPCRKSLKTNIGKPSKEKSVITIDAERRLMDGKYANAYIFILQTGLRVGELIGLRWSDVNLTQGIIKIKRTMYFYWKTHEWKTNEPKTASGIRTVPLTSEAISILKKQKMKNRCLPIIPLQWSDYVFLGQNGEPIKNSEYDTELRKLTDGEFTIHALRHTFATRCIEAGMIPKTLQTILGHANVVTTLNLYVHISEEEKVRGIKRVESALKMVH